MSQTIDFDWEGSKEGETGLYATGTGILEVCEKSICMVDRCLSGVKATGTGILVICEGVNFGCLYYKWERRGRDEPQLMYVCF